MAQRYQLVLADDRFAPFPDSANTGKALQSRHNSECRRLDERALNSLLCQGYLYFAKAICHASRAPDHRPRITMSRAASSTSDITVAAAGDRVASAAWHGDREAAHKLVTSHLRLVTKIARDYRGYWATIARQIARSNYFPFAFSPRPR
jgi:DNA-directed RNA polymerase sigma subunit (sigma70/sigma32)